MNPGVRADLAGMALGLGLLAGVAPVLAQLPGEAGRPLRPSPMVSQTTPPTSPASAAPSLPVSILLETSAGRLLRLPAPAVTVMAADPRTLAAPTDAFRPATDLDRILYRRQVARGVPATPLPVNVDAGFILE